MTPDSAPIPIQTQAPSTAGMTTKVVKGSLWTLLGQVLPLGVSLFATPFVIRMLGSEGYGVLILVGLIPTYFAFADFGMGIASTKFGSEAYAQGDEVKEGRTVRTAALIAFLVSLPFGLGIFFFSGWIATIFNIPDHLYGEAALALKFASVTFVINFLNNIFNTPQLTRLRMDLNTLVTSGFRIVGIIATPIVIYLGGGIAGSVFVLLASSTLTLLGHLYISGRLLKGFFGFSMELGIIRPLIKFGGALAISGIAAVVLVNLEKLVLTRVTSVEMLAYYSVAFTFANMATNFSGGMAQSLIPAFSQLLTRGKKEELNNLFSRGFRINTFGLLLICTVLIVAARPFFTFWAGEEFGRESTLPLYVLTLGLLFNLNAYIAGSLLIAIGRADIYAKLFWIELLPYIVLTGLLTSRYGAVGAAVAWTLRVVIEAFFFIWLAKRAGNLQFSFVGNLGKMVVGILVLLPPIIYANWFDNFSPWLLIVLILSSSVYLFLVWKFFIELDERNWLNSRARDYWSKISKLV